MSLATLRRPPLPPLPATTAICLVQFSRDVAVWLVLNSVIAGVLYLGLDAESGMDYGRLWVYAQSIGFITFFSSMVARRVFWPGRVPSPWGMVLVYLGAVVVGYVAGYSLASWMLGSPEGIVDFVKDILHVEMAARAGAFTLLLTMLGGAFGVFILWRRAEFAHLEAELARQALRAEEVERRATESHLRMLSAQIEPHMLFNTLANLRCLVATDPTRAQFMLDRLIQLLRLSLTVSRADRVSLKDAFWFLHAYLDLLAIRMGERLKFTLDLPVALENTMVAPRLLQPLVENAIKHGLEPKIEGGSVHVLAAVDGDRLLLTVADTGVGRAEEVSPTGVGLSLVAERLTAIYGAGARMDITDNLPFGVKIVMSIPFAALNAEGADSRG
ncbi:MAG: histidine kinase [Betaproteobacteria bacterium]